MFSRLYAPFQVTETSREQIRQKLGKAVSMSPLASSQLPAYATRQVPHRDCPCPSVAIDALTNADTQLRLKAP
jgi:hypothetical protein